MSLQRFLNILKGPFGNNDMMPTWTIKLYAKLCKIEYSNIRIRRQIRPEYEFLQVDYASYKNILHIYNYLHVNILKYKQQCTKEQMKYNLSSIWKIQIDMKPQYVKYSKKMKDLKVDTFKNICRYIVSVIQITSQN